MSGDKTELQKHTIVYTDIDFETRFYPATSISTIRIGAKMFKELSGLGFSKRARYNLWR